MTGTARTQSRLNKNYAPELPTLGAIAGVNPTAVQWKGLTLGNRLLDHGNPYAR